MSRLAQFLVGLALVLALGAGGFAMWRSLRPHGGRDNQATTWLGRIALVYPPSFARFPQGKSGGRLDKLELAVILPEFKPAGDVMQTLPAAGAVAEKPIMFITIEPEQRTVAPADRVGQLYSNFLEPEALAQDSGLMMRRFQENAPFAGEDLYFDPPEGRKFAARCARPAHVADNLPETCIAAQRMDGLDIEYRFSRDALVYWEQIAEGGPLFIRDKLTRAPR
jgi:hypothetical protein